MPQLGSRRQQVVDIDRHVGAVERADAQMDDAGRHGFAVIGKGGCRLIAEAHRGLQKMATGGGGLAYRRWPGITREDGVGRLIEGVRNFCLVASVGTPKRPCIHQHKHGRISCCGPTASGNLDHGLDQPGLLVAQRGRSRTAPPASSDG